MIFVKPEHYLKFLRVDSVISVNTHYVIVIVLGNDFYFAEKKYRLL